MLEEGLQMAALAADERSKSNSKSALENSDLHSQSNLVGKVFARTKKKLKKSKTLEKEEKFGQRGNLNAKNLNTTFGVQSGDNDSTRKS